MIDRKPITRLNAVIGSLSALTPPERYWLYKLVENIVLYDRTIERAPSLDYAEDMLASLTDEWYEIQSLIKERFDESTVVSINSRCIPTYRMYRRWNKGDDDEQA